VAQIKAAFLERELMRGMRPNARQFVSPNWRRFVPSGSDLASVYERYERKYRPDQARVPAGSSEGGQWTDDGGHSTNDEVSSRTPAGTSADETIEFSAASRKGGVGHHQIPRAIYKKLNLPEETRKVFEKSTTGPVPTRGHRWDDAHRRYNKAVEQLTQDYLRENNIQPEKMTPEQARSLIKAVRQSTNPAIRNYNMGIRMLQFLYRLRTGIRGGGVRGTE